MAISTEVFAVVFLNGFIREMKTARQISAALIISFINALMGLLGFFTGLGLNLLLENLTEWLSVVIILMLGLKIMIKSFKPKFHEMTWELQRFTLIAVFSAATGINSYLAGIAISSFKVTGLSVFILILSAYFLAAALGMMLGKISKNFFVASRSGIAAGVILIGISVIYSLFLFGII